MFKYYVEKTDNDKRMILYVSESKADVMAKAKEIRRKRADDEDTISVCGAEFNSDNRRADNRCKFYGIIR